MSIKSFTKGVADSYKSNVAPALHQFREDVSEKSREFQREQLEAKLASLDGENEEEEQTEQPPVSPPDTLGTE